MTLACCGADTGKDAGLGTFSTVRTSLWVPASVLAGEAVNAQADAQGTEREGRVERNHPSGVENSKPEISTGHRNTTRPAAHGWRNWKTKAP